MISNQARINMIKSGKKIRKLQLKNDLLTKGGCSLTKIRTGTYQFVNKLVFNKIIDRKHLNECIFCNKKTVENLEHLFIYYKAWKNERWNYLGITTLEDQPTDLGSADELKKLLSAVLGGDRLASNWKPAEILSVSCRFLSAITKRRSILISNMSKMIN